MDKTTGEKYLETALAYISQNPTLEINFLKTVASNYASLGNFFYQQACSSSASEDFDRSISLLEKSLELFVLSEKKTKKSYFAERIKTMQLLRYAQEKGNKIPAAIATIKSAIELSTDNDQDVTQLNDQLVYLKKKVVQSPQALKELASSEKVDGKKYPVTYAASLIEKARAIRIEDFDQAKLLFEEAIVTLEDLTVN